MAASTRKSGPRGLAGFLRLADGISRAWLWGSLWRLYGASIAVDVADDLSEVMCS